MNTNEPIPEEALERGEPYGPGCWGFVDLRRKAVRDAAKQLEVSPPDRPDLAPIVQRGRVLGQQITQKLWHLLTALEEHEAGQKHIQEELDAAGQSIAELNALRPAALEARGPTRTHGAEQLRSQLGREAREGIRRWLEARAEAEEAIAEQHAEFVHILGKVELATGIPLARPEFAVLFKFLREPPRHEVLILDSEACP